jgi:hypothetical protein
VFPNAEAVQTASRARKQKYRSGMFLSKPVSYEIGDIKSQCQTGELRKASFLLATRQVVAGVHWWSNSCQVCQDVSGGFRYAINATQPLPPYTCTPWHTLALPSRTVVLVVRTVAGGVPRSTPRCKKALIPRVFSFVTVVSSVFERGVPLKTGEPKFPFQSHFQILP